MNFNIYNQQYIGKNSMDESTDMDILASFLDEAGQCIATLNEKLLEVESGDVDKEVIGEMFRAAHSMKGSAGFLNLEDISLVTHNLETVLDWVRKDKLEFTTEVTDALFDAFDIISVQLAALTTDTPDYIDIKPVIKQLETVLGITENNGNASSEPEDELGPLPDWLKGKLSIDDILEAMVAKNAGKKIYALRLSLRSVHAKNKNLIALHHMIEHVVKVQAVIPISMKDENPWESNTSYAHHVGIFCFCKNDIRDELSSLPLFNSFAWILTESDKLPEPVLIRPETVVDLGEPCAVLEVAEGMEKHYRTWLSETKEELQTFENAIMSCEKEPDVSEHLHEMFRLMHRIKSSCHAMGFSEMGRIAHNSESLLSLYRAGDDVPDEKTFQILLKTKDFLQECYTNTENKIHEAPDVTELDNMYLALFERFNYKEMTGDTDEAEQWTIHESDLLKAKEAVEEGLDVWKICIELSPSCMLPDVRLCMILRDLEEDGAILAAAPNTGQLEAGISDCFILKVLYATQQSEASIKDTVIFDMVEDIWMEKYNLTDSLRGTGKSNEVTNDSDGGSTKVARAASATQVDTVRVDTTRLDSLMNTAGEMIITKARISMLSESIRHSSTAVDLTLLDSFIGKMTSMMEGQPELKQQFGLDADKLKRLEKTSDAIKEISSHSGLLSDTIMDLHRHTSTMQNSVIQIRMIPVGPLFQRFHRLVRDLCKERDRDARLLTSGETTELDKKLIDELTDPLTHLVRNSVDHGLESPEERKAAGKDEEAMVKLDAFHEGGQICIRVQDNGRGLDREKIVEKGLKNGIINSSEVGHLSDEDAYSLIFQPGFSTAEKVTNISGRGVGMDIVKSKVNELKGKIDISTELDVGTTFTIRLPLTLAMIEALLVEIGGIRYAFPLESVREIVELTEGEVKSIEGKSKVIVLRDEAIALLDLSDSVGTGTLNKYSKTTRAVITKGASETMAICVDHVIGDEEIVVKPLPEEFCSVKGISGATVLGDGGIALILDVNIIHELSKKGSSKEIV